jgi:hypothetical protein
MTAIRRRLLPATARHLIADAGPPRPWIVGAFAWRRAFAQASRGIRPSEIPTRILVGLSAYELLATLVVALVVLIALALGWG